MLSENGGGPLSKMHGLEPKIHLKSPLAPQPVPLKLDSMPLSKGPFSANIHPVIPVGDVNQAQCRRAYSRQLVSFNGGRRTAHAPSIVSKVNT